jgi:hypothetical protein
MERTSAEPDASLNVARHAPWQFGSQGGAAIGELIVDMVRGRYKSDPKWCFQSFSGFGPSSQSGLPAHKCIFVNNMTPNDSFTSTKVPELNYIADRGTPNLANSARLDIKAMYSPYDAGNKTTCPVMPDRKAHGSTCGILRIPACLRPTPQF